MPKKSRRVAVKQAELSHKKRRAPKQPLQPEARVPIVRDETTSEIESPMAAIPREIPAPDLPGRALPTRPASAPVPRPVNPYIWLEMKRIGILTGMMLSILVVLTFFLR